MTFKFTYNKKEYDVKLTNGLVMDIEEAYDKPIETKWHTIGEIHPSWLRGSWLYM